MTLIKFYIIKDGFDFSLQHSYLIPYNEFYKKLMRNYEKINLCLFADLSKRHKVEYTDFDYMDFLVDNEMYLKVMLFLDINHIAILKNFLEIQRLKNCIGNCNIIVIDESTIDEFLEKDYVEFNNEKLDSPTI